MNRLRLLRSKYSPLGRQETSSCSGETASSVCAMTDPGWYRHISRYCPRTWHVVAESGWPLAAAYAHAALVRLRLSDGGRGAVSEPARIVHAGDRRHSDRGARRLGGD